jgi:hypothetical protein
MTLHSQQCLVSTVSPPEIRSNTPSTDAYPSEDTMTIQYDKEVGIVIRKE